jgi:hypothetical protein
MLTGIISGQTNQKSAVKQSLPAMKSLLSGTGLPYKIVNDSLAVIPYGGANIESYQVIVQKIGDLFIIYSNLTESLPSKIDETMYKYLLTQNNHFDIVKIGLSEEDNTVYLRADIYRAGTTTTLLKRIIEQVANVTNIIGGELK